MTEQESVMSEQEKKRNEAMRRGMSLARMQDYGLSGSQAEAAHALSASGQRWEDVLCGIAEAARRKGEYGQAAAAMNFAQMAENFDTPARMALYRQAMDDFRRHVETMPNPPRRVDLPFGPGRLLGWDFNHIGNSHAALIVIGGMSGWASSFARIAHATTSRGIRCLLLDGPGQGDSRIEGGLYLQHGYAAGISKAVDYLETTGTKSIGIWGNSMGGLFAAASARDEPRLKAVCVNGAPVRMTFPTFRTAAEQMAALFGASSIAEAEAMPDAYATFAALSFKPNERPLPCPVLVCEGGSDPLVALGEQAAFLTDNAHASSQVLTWSDGEHVIYNHADQRNEKIVDWFLARLGGPVER
jgi:alpha-beta hydrolase superfamily lysophospholipase